jgi:L-ascorbate metabolism protein UlaG (beta-lactamase superfamily)
MAITITWIGHSTFTLDVAGHLILLDPFLTNNPLTEFTSDDLNPELILLSHAHGDHVGFTDDGPATDTISIAQRTGATIVCNFEMGNWFIGKGLQNVFQGNPGGTFRNDYLTAKWTLAFHSSSFGDGSYGGQPNGFVITVDDKKLYFAGDTALFSDMSLIGDEGVEMAFLPIGDVFTMGIEDSIKAVKLVKPNFVIPMHYNTFPPIQQDVRQWAEIVNRETDAQPIVLDPGGSHTLS